MIDTPASVEFNLKALGALIKYADYIVIPSGVRGEEMDSLRGVLEMLRTQRTARYCVVFNGVKPKQIEAVTAQSALAMVPDIDLAPIPIAGASRGVSYLRRRPGYSGSKGSEDDRGVREAVDPRR